MEKNNPRICKICNRRFANGKAMGGHMRSHLLKLKLAPPPPSNSLSSPPASSLTCPSKHEQQLSSETESPKTGRRSKRLRKFALNSSSDSVSSFSSLSSEDAAMCLLMLSRDHQLSRPKRKFKTGVDYEISFDDEDMDFDNENDDEFSAKTHSKHYKCETCNKTFRSHQALGGNRASHNHKNKQIMEEEDDDENSDDDHQIHHQQRIFECPFCDKVFQSGQALGGHKKVHFAYLPVAAHNKASTYTSSSTVQSFDLNLPATVNDDYDYDDDVDDEVSLFENATPSFDPFQGTFGA